MTKAQAIKYSLIAPLLILVGAFIFYKVWWTQGVARFLGLVGFALVGFGSILMGVALTRIIGATTTKTINAISGALFIVFMVGTAYGVVTSVNSYEKTQLSTFGQIQSVMINDIRYKGSAYAFFDFYFDGKTYSNHLDPKDYEVGDSATIIFSTDNPDVVKWAEDFDVNGE